MILKNIFLLDYFYLFLLHRMEIEIPKDHEFRIEVSENQKVRFMVIAGLAEICGQELLNEKWYSFSNIKLSIFTFTSARLKMDGAEGILKYVAELTCFRKIFNFFDFCQKYSKDNTIKDESNIKEKIILVLGRGRSTFCTTMINYSVKLFY